MCKIVELTSFFLPLISTILVEPCCEARLTEGGDVCMTVGSDPHRVLGTELNTVQLSIFSHRFMSIAGMSCTEKQMERGEWGRSYTLVLTCRNIRFVVHHRADGQSPPKDFHLHKHQGAPGLLLCCVWTRWRSGIQCAPHTCPPGGHARNCSVPGEGCIMLNVQSCCLKPK